MVPRGARSFTCSHCYWMSWFKVEQTFIVNACGEFFWLWAFHLKHHNEVTDIFGFWLKCITAITMKPSQHSQSFFSWFAMPFDQALVFIWVEVCISQMVWFFWPKPCKAELAVVFSPSRKTQLCDCINRITHNQPKFAHLWHLWLC